jgi:hypothetical protein
MAKEMEPTDYRTAEMKTSRRYNADVAQLPKADKLICPIHLEPFPDDRPIILFDLTPIHFLSPFCPALRA